MEFGVLHIVQNFRDRYDDTDIMRESLRIADLYEELGFDFCFMPEHHFTGYSMGPAPFDFLSYMAGRTKRLKLGPGVIIVPWNDPYRAASHIISLDHLSNGRAMLGLGRGLSAVEMQGFGIDTGDTRGLFDEGAKKIIDAVTTGTFPGGGRFHSHMNTVAMRPAPRKQGWTDRTFCVGMSPDSASEAGRLGARLMTFGMGTWESFRDGNFRLYMEAFRENHPDRKPGPLVLAENCFVHEDRERAHELASEYIGKNYDVTDEFYGFSKSAKEVVKGYEAYAERRKLTENMDYEEKRKRVIAASVLGTPADVLEQLRERRRIIGHPFDFCVQLNGGEMPFDVAEECYRTISTKIIPVIHKWDDEFRDPEFHQDVDRKVSAC